MEIDPNRKRIILDELEAGDINGFPVLQPEVPYNAEIVLERVNNALEATADFSYMQFPPNERLGRAAANIRRGNRLIKIRESIAGLISEGISDSLGQSAEDFLKQQAS